MTDKASLELWGGLECTINRVGDRFIDQLELARAYALDTIVDLVASTVVRRMRWPVLWERVAPSGLERADWEWSDRTLRALVERGIEPIVGLVHHGSGPRDTNLLDPRYATWDALFEDAARAALVGDAKPGRTWGMRNTAHICHPLAAALPLIGRRLCMPADALDGDSLTPRAVAPAFGASERMVVSPGHEADGITHMPGGQSGHPLSPFWGAGHDDWVHGRPTPFLPDAARYRLVLAPRQ